MSEKESVQVSEEAPDAKTLTAVDTVHNDEALKVIAGYNGDREWTEEEENKIRRKIDWKLMPVLCFTYSLQYYDKAMLSQAVRLPRGRNYSTPCLLGEDPADI
jgi:hypothetical protein